MRVWEEWVVGWLVGWTVTAGERGCVGEVGGRVSNLGVHFGVWKTVGLFQLECNISTEHVPSRFVTLRAQTRRGKALSVELISIHPQMKS